MLHDLARDPAGYARVEAEVEGDQSGPEKFPMSRPFIRASTPALRHTTHTNGAPSAPERENPGVGPGVPINSATDMAGRSPRPGGGGT